MKRISELTEQELLNMTDEARELQIDFECAHLGIPMLPSAPGPEPTSSVILPTTKAYIICGLTMLDGDLAQRILAVVTSGQLYNTEFVNDNCWEGPQYLVPLREGAYNYPTIKTENFYTAEERAKIKESVTQAKRDLDAWQIKRKEFDKTCQERWAVADDLSGAIGKARDTAFRKENIIREFDRYVGLAEGNTTIAMNFLLKARPEAAEDFPELIEKLCPGYKTQAEAEWEMWAQEELGDKEEGRF